MRRSGRVLVPFGVALVAALVVSTIIELGWAPYVLIGYTGLGLIAFGFWWERDRFFPDDKADSP